MLNTYIKAVIESDEKQSTKSFGDSANPSIGNLKYGRPLWFWVGPLVSSGFQDGETNQAQCENVKNNRTHSNLPRRVQVALLRGNTVLLNKFLDNKIINCEFLNENFKMLLPAALECEHTRAVRFLLKETKLAARHFNQLWHKRRSFTEPQIYEVIVCIQNTIFWNRDVQTRVSAMALLLELAQEHRVTEAHVSTCKMLVSGQNVTTDQREEVLLWLKIASRNSTTEESCLEILNVHTMPSEALRVHIIRLQAVRQAWVDIVEKDIERGAQVANENIAAERQTVLADLLKLVDFLKMQYEKASEKGTINKENFTTDLRAFCRDALMTQDFCVTTTSYQSVLDTEVVMCPWHSCEDVDMLPLQRFLAEFWDLVVEIDSDARQYDRKWLRLNEVDEDGADSETNEAELRSIFISLLDAVDSAWIEYNLLPDVQALSQQNSGGSFFQKSPIKGVERSKGLVDGLNKLAAHMFVVDKKQALAEMYLRLANHFEERHTITNLSGLSRFDVCLMKALNITSSPFELSQSLRRSAESLILNLNPDSYFAKYAMRLSEAESRELCNGVLAQESMDINEHTL